MACARHRRKELRRHERKADVFEPASLGMLRACLSLTEPGRSARQAPVCDLPGRLGVLGEVGEADRPRSPGNVDLAVNAPSA